MYNSASAELYFNAGIEFWVATKILIAKAYNKNINNLYCRQVGENTKVFAVCVSIKNLISLVECLGGHMQNPVMFPSGPHKAESFNAAPFFI